MNKALKMTVEKIAHKVVRRKVAVGLAGVALLIVGFFQACENPVTFDQLSANSTNNALDDSGQLPGTNDPATQVVASVCQQADSQQRVESTSQTISFPDRGRTCDWSTNGNLERRDQWHQARDEQKVSIALPAGSTLCHVEFQFPNQRFRFDDHFWLTFNSVVLAASLDYRDRLGFDKYYSVFDWSRLVGTHWDQSREKVWCLGGASCDWPKTDTEGRISMDFRDGTYYAITARDRSRTTHEFSLITVGDNDATDCQHRPVSANVTLYYTR